MTQLLITPLIMHHCSRVFLTIFERQSGSYFPKMPLQSICYYLIIQFIAILIGKFFWYVKLYSFPIPSHNASKLQRPWMIHTADSLKCLSCQLRSFRKFAPIFRVARIASPMSLTQFPVSSMVHHCPITSQNQRKIISLNKVKPQ